MLITILQVVILIAIFGSMLIPLMILIDTRKGEKDNE